MEINPPLSKRSSIMRHSSKASNSSDRGRSGTLAEIIMEGEHAAAAKGNSSP